MFKYRLSKVEGGLSPPPPQNLKKGAPPQSAPSLLQHCFSHLEWRFQCLRGEHFRVAIEPLLNSTFMHFMVNEQWR